ncbi:MAG: hypothetical protein BWY31_02678 [Lentisphaerae bacterium ADurb.Bin242]|nr:MAG: hypothetical protein BWY31_02678 [Lentisphaerae bacterium ADurb.Bin242]
MKKSETTYLTVFLLFFLLLSLSAAVFVMLAAPDPMKAGVPAPERYFREAGKSYRLIKGIIRERRWANPRDTPSPESLNGILGVMQSSEIRRDVKEKLRNFRALPPSERDKVVAEKKSMDWKRVIEERKNEIRKRFSGMSVKELDEIALDCEREMLKTARRRYFMLENMRPEEAEVFGPELRAGDELTCFTAAELARLYGVSGS